MFDPVSLAITAAAINLVCTGGGTHTESRTARAYSSENYMDPNAVSLSHKVDIGFEDEVLVQIEGDTGKIRIPKAIRPAINSGGDEGWWRVKDLRITHDEIRGKVTLNPIRNPKIRISRLTGRISISGASGNFSGYCQPYDPATVERRF